MTKTLDSFSTLLGMITDTFLLEEVFRQPSQEKIQRAAETHQASFTLLKKSLAEARSEAILGGPSKPGRPGGRKSLGQAYEDAIDSLNRLGQHLNGLRSGTRLQYDLTRAHLNEKLALKRRREEKRRAETKNGDMSTKVIESVIDEDGEEKALHRVAASMFGDFVDDLGPPLKALSVGFFPFFLLRIYSNGDPSSQLATIAYNTCGKRWWTSLTTSSRKSSASLSKALNEHCSLLRARPTTPSSAYTEKVLILLTLRMASLLRLSILSMKTT
jgi:hypothetical protein